MNQKDQYTIVELESATGLTRRNIHFYIAEGLIPPPSGAGKGAIYSHKHYIRLMLITYFRMAHIKLSGIKSHLDRLSLKQMTALLQKFEEKDQQSVINYIESLPTNEEPQYKGERQTDGAHISSSYLDDMLSEKTKPAEFYDSFLQKKADYASYSQDPQEGLAWRRITIRPGLEIHIREDLENRRKDSLRQIVPLIKKLFM